MQPETDRLDRWIPRLMVLTILAVATFAFVQSYTHGFYWGETHHQSGTSLRMFPLIADWIMFAAGLTMLHLGRKGIKHPLPRTALVLGATVTLAINIAAGIIWGRATALTNSWAPVALFLVVELGMLLVRTAKAKPEEVSYTGLPLPPQVAAAERERQLTELRQPSQASPIPSGEPDTGVIQEVTGSPEDSLSGWGQLGRQGPASVMPGSSEPASQGLTGIGLNNGRK